MDGEPIFYQYNIITATDMDKEICQPIEIDVKFPYDSCQVSCPKINMSYCLTRLSNAFPRQHHYAAGYRH